MSGKRPAKRAFNPIFLTIIGVLGFTSQAQGRKHLKLAVSPTHEATVTGSVSGVLRVRDGCTYLQSGRLKRLIIWPPGTTTLHDDDKSVVVDGIILTNGSNMRAFGGEITANAFSGMDSILAVIKKCKSQIILISNIKRS